MKRYLGLIAVLGFLGVGMKADSSLRIPGFFENNFRTVSGLSVVSVNGEPVDMLAMAGKATTNQPIVAYTSAIDLGNGVYGIVFSHVPKDARHLEVTAQVPDPRRSGRLLTQTLIVDISHKDQVDIPVNIFTN